MPAERGKDAAERFAAAVDQGRSPRDTGSDADLARELEIVARLRCSGAAYAPRPDEKARAKQRLMALLAEQPAPAAGDGERRGGSVVEFPTPTAAEQTAPIPVVADADADVEADPETGGDVELAPVTPLASRASRRTGRHTRVAPATDRRHPGLARRAGLVGSAALLVMVAFTGAGVFASRDALPGQTLYPLKRAAEAAGLAMTFDDEERAQRNLDLAAIRLSEVEQLVALRGGAVDPQLVRAAMLEFDTATSEGSQPLLSNSDAAGNGGINSLQAWAATQSARLSVLRSALPEPAVPAADTSIALLDKLLGRSPELDAPAASPDTEVGASSSPSSPSSENSRNSTEGPAEPGQPNGLPPINSERGPLGEDPAAVDPAQPEAPNEVDEQPEPARLPLPLPGAPVTLPPLLPGMPPLTLG